MRRNHTAFRKHTLTALLAFMAACYPACAQKALPVIEMVEIEGGTFTIGARGNSFEGHWDDEIPAHPVSVQTFHIGKYEVTQALWTEIMGDNPSCWKGDSLPVENVNWYDCQDFIRKLNGRKAEFGIPDHLRFDMPTEAEWEYAAREGKADTDYRYCGGEVFDDVAWHHTNSGDRTHPVGMKKPNALGLYDMTGNVWEWCKDFFKPYDMTQFKYLPADYFEKERVSRGGSWNSDQRDSRITTRNEFEPQYRNPVLGLRLVLRKN